MLDIKPQNKIHYYIISESEDIIDLILTENDIAEAIEEDDKRNLIIIESENSDIFSENDNETEKISN